jgi:hypothetical protein
MIHNNFISVYGLNLKRRILDKMLYEDIKNDKKKTPWP